MEGEMKIELNNKECVFIIETLEAIISGESRVGAKHYTVILWIKELWNLIAKLRREIDKP